ncbi:unnamed protein product [Effrenium voratum]|nr:unnamed protein product [Effrenium voratum]
MVAMDIAGDLRRGPPKFLLQNLLAHTVEPSAKNYNIAISRCRWPTAHSLLQTMQGAGLRRDVFGFSSAMAMGPWRRALWLWQEMALAPIPRNTVTCNALIHT